MSQATIEERVSALESQVARLMSSGGAEKDWRSTIGMFTGDPVMKEIQEEGRKIREADRKRAKRDRS